MLPLCYHCDTELVSLARFCHRCGTPTFSAYRARAGEGDRGERARIKEEVAGAARTPVSTRMTETVLAPRAARRAAAPPPLWLRVLRMRIWRRWYLWAAVGGLAVASVLPTALEHIEATFRQGNELYHIVTRLSAKCASDSRPDLAAFVEKIQKGSGSQLSHVENAALFEYVARSVRTQHGSCATIADALARPDRFERLLR
jgi:hypothetical protein